MNQDDENHYYRVVYSSGGAFYTSAKTSAAFILDPVFIQFMVMSIFLFTSLMLALGVPFIPQVILLGAGLVATFFCMYVAISIYALVLRMTGWKTLYTPLLLAPMQIANAIMIDYVVRLFGSSYLEGFNSVWEITLRTLIIFICLDIFHGKFVAPQHRLTVALDNEGKVIPLAQAKTVAINVPPTPASVQREAHNSETSAVKVENEATDVSVSDTEASASVPDATSPSVADYVEIGKDSFELEFLEFIKSEDHYLFVQSANRSAMVRGRLQEVAAKIDVKWGLQINRSIWVSYAAISQVRETPKGHLDVELKDGSVLRVAGARKKFFEHSCTQYKATVDWVRSS